MSKIFILIYEWFSCHRKAFYLILTVVIGACAIMASQIELQENITNFFNSSKNNKNAIFDTIEAKDRIVVMISGRDPDSIIKSADIFEEKLSSSIDNGLIQSITAHADTEAVDKCIDFIYEYLPIFLTDDDFDRLERCMSADSISSVVSDAYNILTSPSGMIVDNLIMQDPLNIGTPLLRNFEKFKPEVEYEIYDGRLFVQGLTTMLMFIEPSNGMGDTGKNDKLVRLLEESGRTAESEEVKIEYIGGPIVAVYNARQIKTDTFMTLGLAMVVILVVILLSFRNKRSIPLIVIPPAFGGLFALAVVWLIQGEISAIAIGAGTVVLGISLSYSMHIVAHLNNTSSPKEILEELATPLTIGCFTTIGAFGALMFTSSALLQDMGLFSVFALIGTIVFCLIFLPQFMSGYKESGKSMMLNNIERIAGYQFDGNKWVVLLLSVLTFITLFFYQDAGFDDNMSDINYMPNHLAKAEVKSSAIFGNHNKEVYIVTSNADLDILNNEYCRLVALLRDCKINGEIDDFATLDDFLVPIVEQKARIAKWNYFWHKNRDRFFSKLNTDASKCGFNTGAFDGFKRIIDRNYKPCAYSDKEIGNVPGLSEWILGTEKSHSLMCRISISDGNKDVVYSKIDKLRNTAILDRGYFSAKMVEATSNDFNYILLVSSFIVFIALLISYGRIELTLLTFLPMAVSWVIILGLMSIFGIKFNIVNIILATFIFGIGDDFSIFIMDGLMQEYKCGKKMLYAHKTAIFFSAFTAIVGMGVFVFAKHPALQSIAIVSVLGLSVVVLVAYTIQPMLFNLMVTKQTINGNFPYTLGSLLNTIYCFTYFLLGCIILQLCMAILTLLPVNRDRKKLFFHKLLNKFTRLFLGSMIVNKIIRQNPYKEDFAKPALIIANHQSFIDILLLLSVTPKIVMVTNNWVWRSPFFGIIVKYADFYNAAVGADIIAEQLQKCVNKGYSIVVFPEGTRSDDCTIRRFHKGAFYLAQRLGLDIVPSIIYGAGHTSAKRQGFYIKSGIVAIKIMQRIKSGNGAFGYTYQEQSKNYRKWYEKQYLIMCREFNYVGNHYFKEAVIKNYIYKGPALEWYIRYRCQYDGYYNKLDNIIPYDATITDIGCGFGQMSFMLKLLSPDRKITGIDIDTDKIVVARESFLQKKYIVDFINADSWVEPTIPMSDVILYNNSLCYMDCQMREQLLNWSIKSLNCNGRMIIIDHYISATEAWLTKMVGNSDAVLSHIKPKQLQDFADAHNMKFKMLQYGKRHNQTIYIITMRNRYE